MPVNPDELRSATQWWTYSNDKAVTRLGWRPPPHEETLDRHGRVAARAARPRVRRGHTLTDAGLRASGAAAKLVPFGLAR